MKIIYAALKYDYGDPKRGYGYEHYNFYDSLVKMNGCENKVIYFPYDEIILKIGRDKMNDKLLETVHREKPDVCFFSLFGDEFKKETIGNISKNLNIPTIVWFFDDCWRFYNYTKYWAPYFNWVVSTDWMAPINYKSVGYKNIIKSQFACNHFLYKAQNLPKIYDVTFVGQPHGDRKKIVEKIKKAGINIECWGKGWPNGRVSQEEMMRIFCQSKINLNLARGSGDVSLKGLAMIFLKRGSNSPLKFQNPKDWVNNFKSLLGNIRSHLKARNFETPGCNAFSIVGDADNFRDYYEDGKEVVIYKNTKDLIKKIKYYLEHDEEREAIAKTGYERTIRDHTYEKRFNEIFKTIGLIK